MSDRTSHVSSELATQASAHKVHHVPLYVRVGWGMGGIADNLMANTLFALGMIIYVTAFNMQAGLAGLALSIPRFVDAITDPIIGNFSDNLRTRFGRRRPMIVVGVIGSAILLPLMWFPPMLETIEEPWYRNGPFWYLAISGSVYFVFYTLFMVPYTALGFELTDDYDERTRVLAWRMYLGLFASMTIPALYWLCRREMFGDGVQGEINGARWVSLGLGGVVLVTGLLPVLTTRERMQVLDIDHSFCAACGYSLSSRPDRGQCPDCGHHYDIDQPDTYRSQPTIPILAAVRQTMTNGPFVILFLAYIAVIMGLLTAGTVGTFALIYYVFQDTATVDIAKDHASTLGLIAGLVAATTAYFSMFIAGWVSRKTGKRVAMMLGLGFMLLGTLSIWFLYDPRFAINAPDFVLTRWFVDALGFVGIEVAPEAFKVGVLLATMVGALGGQGCWLMIDSMTADICDEDELQTGRRREGMFGAAQGFGRKLAVALTVLLGGYLLQWLGFDAAAANTAGGVSDTVADRMLITLMVCQGGGLVIALIVFFFYPITRERAEQTRAKLEARRGEANLPSVD